MKTIEYDPATHVLVPREASMSMLIAAEIGTVKWAAILAAAPEFVQPVSGEPVPECFMCHGTGKHAMPYALPAGVPVPPVMMIDCQQCKVPTADHSKVVLGPVAQPVSGEPVPDTDIDTLRRDALRYRLLRERSHSHYFAYRNYENGFNGSFSQVSGTGLDRYIDKAMQAKGEGS